MPNLIETIVIYSGMLGIRIILNFQVSQGFCSTNDIIFLLVFTVFVLIVL